MSKSQFARVISLVNRDAQSVTVELIEGFRDDLRVYLTSNNRTRLDEGVRSLIGQTAFLKKVRACIPPLDTVKGYSGAQTGAFEKQPASVQAPYLAQLEALTEALTASLKVAGLFEKKELSEEAKAKRASKKSEKAEADKKALKEAIIAEEGLVPASTVYGQAELVDMIVDMLRAGTLDPENAALLSEALALAKPSAKAKAKPSAKAKAKPLEEALT